MYEGGNAFNIALTFAAPTLLTALAGWWITRRGLAKYNTMEKSNLTPPGYVFSIVWTVIYIAIIFAGYLYYSRQSDQDSRINFLNVFYVQLLLNFVWTLAFFGSPSKNNARLGLLLIFLLLIVVVYLAAVSWKLSPWSTYIFSAYAIWLVFAFILNFQFINKN